MKVYCVDCKHFDGWATCKNPSTKHEESYWAFKEIGWGYAPRMNADNDCKLYERKWWKFWLEPPAKEEAR